MVEWNLLNGSAHDDSIITTDEPPCVPFCCGHFIKSNEEESVAQRRVIHGLAMDVYGRATIGMSSIFLGPALLSLANQAAGDGCDDCTIHGFRPSSLLTNMAALSGFLGCIALPFFGSIIDHTSLRKSIGLYTGIGMILLKSIECIALRFPKLWLYIAATQIASSVTFYVHLTATYAYLSELSTHPAQQSYYNTSLFVIMYASTLIFMLESLGLSSLLPSPAAAVNEDVRTARLALAITIATCAPCFGYAWTRCFPHRPATRVVPPGQTVATAGFYTLRTTCGNLAPPLRFVLASVALSEAAANAIIVVSTTYMKQMLQMKAQDIGIVFFIVLLSGVPGSQLGRAITAYTHNPVVSLGCCNLFFIASTLIASMVLRGPEDQHLCRIFGFCWGLALGWLQPQNTSLYIPLLPSTNATQVTEMMGLYVFACQILSWLPPTVFTVMNESQISMYYGLGSLSIYFLLSLWCLFAVGDYPRLLVANRSHLEDALEHTEVDDDDNHEMVHYGNGATRTYLTVSKDEVLVDNRIGIHELT